VVAVSFPKTPKPLSNEIEYFYNIKHILKNNKETNGKYTISNFNFPKYLRLQSN
jgi:hypothetical protein